MIEAVTKRFARRKGLQAAQQFKAKWKHEIAIAIQRRKAAMLRAVLPSLTGRQAWLEGRGEDRESAVAPILVEEEPQQRQQGE